LAYKIFLCVAFHYVNLYKETQSMICFEGQPASRIFEPAVHSEQLSKRSTCASGLPFQTWK